MKNPGAKTKAKNLDALWYEGLMEISPVGIFFTDAKGNCLHVNQSWCEIAGLTLEQAMGRGWTQAIHKDDFAWVSKQWYESACRQQAFHAEYRFCRPDGKITWVVGDARAKYSKNGKVEGYIGTVTDITSYRVALDELQRSEKRVQTIIAHMPVILFAFDDQGYLCAWNQEAERVSGYTAKEMIGNPDAMKTLCPDPHYRRSMLDAYKQRGDDYRNWDWKLVAKDGSVKTISFSNTAKYFPIQGWANWGVGIDVTTQRKTENALRERVKELSCLYHLSQLATRSNLDLSTYLQKAVNLLPESWQYPKITCARITYQDQSFTTKNFSVSRWKLSTSLLIRNRSVGAVEVYYSEQRPEAEEGPFLQEERLLIDEIALQITRTISQVLNERDLALMGELSKKAGELEQFSYSVSHDLKTPLTAIGGYAEFLQKKINQGELAQAKSCAKRILDISNRMDQRLNEILKLAKIGKVIETNTEVAIKEIISETLIMMQRQLEKADLTVSLDQQFPVVLGDRIRLLEVIENVMDNAIKYCGDPPNHLHIGCRSTGNEPVIYFEDNGIGIDPQNFEKVFELFHRLDKSTEGDGTGLAIVKRIIEAHGGRVWIESEGLGKGIRCCFTFGSVIEY